MCSPYQLIASTNPGGKPLPDWSPPPKPGGAPPPDRVNDQEVESQTDRQDLADQAQDDVSDWPEKPIDWSKRGPSKDDPDNIKLARLQSGGPMKGKPGSYEYLDENRVQLKLNPDGTPALGFDREYYDNPDNWYSKAELDEYYGNSSANEDGVSL
jgi:hypothetical protein